MSTGFPGFPREAQQFLRDLARHNHRDWFQPRKPVFEEMVKGPMKELVGKLNAAMMTFAPEYVSDPDKAIYRIYRDTRFSKDKTPYKDHIAASFRRPGPPGAARAGCYFEVSHKNVGIGGGVYMPEPDALLAVRTHIAERHQDLRRILKAAAVRRLFGDPQGDRLTRVPKGFPADHPAADLLRFKSLFLWTELPADVAATPALYREILTRFRAMTPFLDFLNAAPPKPRRKLDARDLF